MSSVVTSLGLGSGVDVAGLVESLLDSEREPVETRLDSKEELYEAQISAYGSLKSAAYELQGSIGNLDAISTFKTKNVTSSNESILTATASSIADEGSYDIVVSNKAKAHSLATTTFSSVNDSIGTGTLTFRFGTTDYVKTPESYNGFTLNEDEATKTVTIGSGDNSLAGVRDAINEADIGVQATIVKSGASQYQLVITSDTGSDQSMEITVDDADDTDTDSSGLSMLAFNSSATNLEQVQAAEDALVSVNGLTVSSSSNTLTSVISGISIDITKADEDESVTLSVENDTSGVKSLIEDFVETYNSFINTISEYNSYDAGGDGASGVLFGDAVLRTMTSEIRSLVSSSVDGLGTTISSLASIGISSRVYDGITDVEEGELPQLAGMLEIDEDMLDNALSSYFQEVGALFAPTATVTASSLTYITSTSETKVGEYSVNITQAATQAEYEGASAHDYSSALTIDDDNDTFAIQVDGSYSSTITLSHGDYSTGSSLAAEIQSKINGDSVLESNGVSVSVSFDSDNDRFVLNSSSYGSDSSIEIREVDTNTTAELGLSVADGTDGVDVAGTIGGEPALGSGQDLTGSGVNVSGLMLTYTGSTIGTIGIVNFSRGISESLYNVLDSYTTTNGLLDSKVDGLEGSLDDIDIERESLEDKLEKMEARYLASFNAMDLLVSNYNSIGSYLSEQLSLLPGVTMYNDK
ncbi:MAG: flagellar hook protein [Gammaproteobacteria bacterium]|nr:MAG: flagellar hook protein [Gammaproteobacteria bacterium]